MGNPQTPWHAQSAADTSDDGAGGEPRHPFTPGEPRREAAWNEVETASREQHPNDFEPADPGYPLQDDRSVFSRADNDLPSPSSNDPDTKQEAQRLASDAADRASDVAGTVQQEASSLASTAQQQGGEVLDTAKREGAHVVDEAKQQGQVLLDEGISELKSQAEEGQHRVAGLVRSLSGELSSMSENATERGVVVELVDQLQHYGHDAATYLENNRPEDVLQSVRRYAARNPWTFLAISAGVGFLAARFVRGLQRDDSQDLARPQVGSGQRDQGGLAHRQGEQLLAPSYSDDQTRLRGGAPGTYPSATAAEAQQFGEAESAGYDLHHPNYPITPQAYENPSQDDLRNEETR